MFNVKEGWADIGERPDWIPVELARELIRAEGGEATDDDFPLISPYEAVLRAWAVGIDLGVAAGEAKAERAYLGSAFTESALL